MAAARSVRPKLGLLALTLELYETLSPGLRENRDQWVRRQVLRALKPVADVVFEGAAFTREQVEARVAALRAADVDAIVVMLLTYAPSQIALAAMQHANVPILLWNTQELFAVTGRYSGDDLSNNHGVHGTQDLANVLVRSGVKFFYHTSHLSDGVGYVADFAAAAAASRRLGRARLGILGYPFPGMGDFALDTTHLVATLGCATTVLSMEDYVQRAAGADRKKVAALVRRYRESYAVADGVTAAALDATARVEISLRSMIAENRLDAFTYQFLAFGQDERVLTVPFVAASRLLSEGVGFGGEGDLIAAGGAVFLNWLSPPASFGEIFTIDFGGNSVLLSHMGEANVAMARSDRRVPLVARPGKITRTLHDQLCLVTSFEPGAATLMSLTLVDKQRWRLIAAAGQFLDFGPLDSMCTPHAKFAPSGDVRQFLTGYATAGGPHHLAVCRGDARARLALAARMLNIDYCEV